MYKVKLCFEYAVFRLLQRKTLDFSGGSSLLSSHLSLTSHSLYDLSVTSQGLLIYNLFFRDINKPQVNGFFSWNILEIYRFTARKGRQLNSKVWSVVCCCFNIFVWNTSIWKEDCLYVATFTTNFVNGDRILGSKLAWDTNQTPGWRAPVTSHIPFILLVFLASFMAYCSPP